MAQNNVVRAYNVQFYDDHLDVDDFNTVNANSEDDAEDVFLSSVDNEERYTIQNVTKAYELNKSKIEKLLGDLETI